MFCNTNQLMVGKVLNGFLNNKRLPLIGAGNH